MKTASPSLCFWSFWALKSFRVFHTEEERDLHQLVSSQISIYSHKSLEIDAFLTKSTRCWTNTRHSIMSTISFLSYICPFLILKYPRTTNTNFQLHKGKCLELIVETSLHWWSLRRGWRWCLCRGRYQRWSAWWSRSNWKTSIYICMENSFWVTSTSRFPFLIKCKFKCILANTSWLSWIVWRELTFSSIVACYIFAWRCNSRGLRRASRRNSTWLIWRDIYWVRIWKILELVNK